MVRRAASILFTASAALLAACSPPVIADLEHDKVIVQAEYGTDPATIASEASRGCAIHGRHAIPISKRCVDEYCFTSNHLFACKK